MNRTIEAEIEETAQLEVSQYWLVRVLFSRLNAEAYSLRVNEAIIQTGLPLIAKNIELLHPEPTHKPPDSGKNPLNGKYWFFFLDGDVTKLWRLRTGVYHEDNDEPFIELVDISNLEDTKGVQFNTLKKGGYQNSGLSFHKRIFQEKLKYVRGFDKAKTYQNIVGQIRLVARMLDNKSVTVLDSLPETYEISD